MHIVSLRLLIYFRVSTSTLLHGMNLLLQHFVAIKTGTNAGNVDSNWQQPDLLPSSSAATLFLRTYPIAASVEYAGSAAVRTM